MTCHLTPETLFENKTCERAYFTQWYEKSKPYLSVSQTNFLDLMISNRYYIKLQSHNTNPSFRAANIPSNETKLNINQGDIDVSITMYY
jgi:hypothetical protein